MSADDASGPESVDAQLEDPRVHAYAVVGGRVVEGFRQGDVAARCVRTRSGFALFRQRDGRHVIDHVPTGYRLGWTADASLLWLMLDELAIHLDGKTSDDELEQTIDAMDAWRADVEQLEAHERCTYATWVRRRRESIEPVEREGWSRCHPFAYEHELGLRVFLCAAHWRAEDDYGGLIPHRFEAAEEAMRAAEGASA